MPALDWSAGRTERGEGARQIAPAEEVCPEYGAPMSSPRKLRVLPGLLGGLLPLGLQPVSAGLLLVWLGGLDGLSRTLGQAGRSIHLMGVLTVVSALALAL